jgi:hypothetical protein
MEILKDKKILVGGILVLAIVAYFYIAKKKKDNDLSITSTTPSGNSSSTETTPIKDNYTISLGSVDPTNAVYLVLGGKKYAFISEIAFTNYGYTVPEVITKADFDLIPSGGFVNTDGTVVKAS